MENDAPKNNFRLFNKPKLNLKICSENHLKFGLYILILGVIIISFNIFEPDQKLPISKELFVFIAIVQIITGLLLNIGRFFSFSENILAFQGMFIFLLSISYAVFMIFVFNYIFQGNSLEVKIAHSPGVLAFSTAYGMRLFIDASGLFEKLKFSIVRLITVIGFIIGAIFDVALLVLMIKAIIHYTNLSG